MCRLFGVISSDPIDAAYYLKDAPQSLLVQSDVDKKRPQGDGWGIGWFESGKPRIFKSPRAIYRDLARVRKAVKQPEGPILLGHVRWASNPLKLPRHELIGPAHTQPFSHGSWLFAHNGTLFIPREVKAELGPWAKFVKGHNDSEVLFYWLMKTVVYGRGRNWASRLRASLRQLDHIWQGCKSQYPIYGNPYHGLNWVLTNGKVFMTFCYVNSNGFDKAKALCRRGQPYYQLQMRHSHREIVIASEPLDLKPGWRPLRHGQLLLAKKTGRTLTSKVLQVMPCF